MFKQIDAFLDHITMYRLVLYALLALNLVSFALSLLGMSFVPFTESVAFLILLSLMAYLAEMAFSRLFRTPSNLESPLITALILSLIVFPDFAPASLFYALAVTLLSIASKYLLFPNTRQVFNPAGFGIVAGELLLHQSASWQIASLYTVPFVLIAGLLVLRKMRRFDLAIAFFTVTLSVTVLSSLLARSDLTSSLSDAVVSAPLLFFGFFMLTEPATTPATQRLRLAYGALVGLLYTPFIHWGSFNLASEYALMVGNVFTFLIAPSKRLSLTLKKHHALGGDCHEFVFHSPKFDYRPGQYMAWTLPLGKTDGRGNRRFFTIASSPTEPDLRIGVRMNSPSSAFKKSLLAMKEGDAMAASQLAGDFTLPENKDEKLVFIAGGIGVTPFRSMVKYMLDKNEKRDVVFFYSCRTPSDAVYSDIFETAAEKIGLKLVCTVTDSKSFSASNWKGKTGFVDEEMIRQAAPDFADRTFFLSGPRSMVAAFEKTLGKMGVPGHKIKTDYFPGFA